MKLSRRSNAGPANERPSTAPCAARNPCTTPGSRKNAIHAANARAITRVTIKPSVNNNAATPSCWPVLCPTKIQDVAQEWNEQRREHYPELRTASRADDVRQQAAGLGRKAEVKRQIQQYGGQNKRHAEAQHLQEAGPGPAFRAHPQQTICQHDQRAAQQDVPNIQESHSAQHQRRGQETGQANSQAAPEDVYGAAPPAQ